MNIYDLKVNHLTEPVGIAAEKLQFSFKANIGQDFIIKVYDEERADLVYSQKVHIDESHNIYLPFKFLEGKRYYWCVETEGLSSDMTYFETALPLNAKFITPADEDIKCPVISKEFAIGQVKKARLYITGLGLYRVFINGHKVGTNYLTPYYNDYDVYLRYQTYDIGDLLDTENKIEILLGDGWYKGRFGIDGQSGDIYGEKYLACAMLYFELYDGTTLKIETDDSWIGASSNIVNTSIYDGETRDDSLIISNFKPCVIYNHEYNLVPDFSSPVRERMLLKPVLYISPKGEKILDFGQNMVGFCRFKCQEDRGTKVHLQYGEVLQDSCFYNDNLRTAKAEYIYISDGITKEIEPYFTFYGFRYVKVSGIDNVNPEDFTGVVIHSDLQEVSNINTSNEKINKLISNVKWSQRGNFIDVPTDCPQRDERLGWTADAQVFSNTACFHMDSYNFYKKYMRDLRADQINYYDGDIPMYSPSLKKTAGYGGAVWADAATIIPWNIYKVYGDKRLLSEHYDMMRDYINTVIATDKRDGNNHIIKSGFTFGDWLAQDGICPQALLGGTDSTYIKTIYYMNSLRIVANAADVLGKDKDKKFYSEMEAKVREAILYEFFSKSGRLAVDTQTAYVLSLYYNIYVDKNKVIDGLRTRLEKDLYRIKTGFTGTPLILSVLLKNEMVDDAYRILFNENYPGWLYTVNLGATTIWERWNSLLSDGTISGTNMNSLNHYAYGSVCEAIYSHIVGLQNAAPGWKKAIIAPKPNYRLKNIDFSYNSPSGVYKVNWKIYDNGEFELKTTIPNGTTATIILPDHKDKLTFTVSSGEYSYRYKPIVDYNRPYNENTIILDLLQNDQVKRIFKEYLPQAYNMVTGENEEFLTLQFISLGHLPMFETNAEEVMKVSNILKQIKV